MGVFSRLLYTTRNPDEFGPDAGAQGVFPQTRWTLILDAQDDDPSALSDFCRAYWFPLYCYARRKGRSVEDAEDLTQAFFERILSRDFLGQARRERGRMRSFLLCSFDRFAAEEWRRGTAQKRGGGYSFVSVDELPPEDRFKLEQHHQYSPELEYERAWARELLRQALRRLRETYWLEGKQEVFDAFKDQLADGGADGSYREVGARLGLTEAAARFAAFRLRTRYREILHRLVADTVSNRAEVEAELAHMRTLFVA